MISSEFSSRRLIGGGPVIESGWTGTEGLVEVHPLTLESTVRFEAETESEAERGKSTS